MSIAKKNEKKVDLKGKESAIDNDDLFPPFLFKIPPAILFHILLTIFSFIFALIYGNPVTEGEGTFNSFAISYWLPGVASFLLVFEIMVNYVLDEDETRKKALVSLFLDGAYALLALIAIVLYAVLNNSVSSGPSLLFFASVVVGVFGLSLASIFPSLNVLHPLKIFETRVQKAAFLFIGMIFAVILFAGAALTSFARISSSALTSYDAYCFYAALVIGLFAIFYAVYLLARGEKKNGQALKVFLGFFVIFLLLGFIGFVIALSTRLNVNSGNLGMSLFAWSFSTSIFILALAIFGIVVFGRKIIGGGVR